MPRPRELHGAAVQNSPYAMSCLVWVMEDPRITPGKLRQRLMDVYGSEAAFSEPTVRAWMSNYYPRVMQDAARAGISATYNVLPLGESKLFGKVADALDYHAHMIQSLEERLADTEKDYATLRQKASDAKDPETVVVLQTTIIKLRDQMVKFAKEIREYKEIIDDWQRTHDFGKRLGDLMLRMVKLTNDVLFPILPRGTEVEKRKSAEAISDFTKGYKAIGREVGVPSESI